MSKNNYSKNLLLNNRPVHEIWGNNGGVSTMDPISSKIGVDILNNGGNAVDASIAISSTLSVISPNWSGLAGDSVWLYYDSKNKKTFHLDGYSTCPAKASLEKLKKLLKLKNNKKCLEEEPAGIRNTGVQTSMVPGTPFLLDYAWKKWGSKKFQKLIEPSIKLAREGFPISDYLYKAFNENNKKINQFSSTKRLIKKNKKILPGSTFIQQDLADTLERFSINRSNEFRNGLTVKKIINYMKNKNHLFSLNDFKKYKVKERKIFQTNFRDHQIISTGMPTSGISLLQSFKLLEKFNLNNCKFLSDKYFVLLAKILQKILIERRQNSSDPDFINFDQSLLLNNESIKKILNKKNYTLKKNNNNKGGTTHFCVWDKYDNIVSGTQSIGYQFGCGEVIEDTGLFMNDRTWWMSLDENSINKVMPNKRCNIGHAPTIIFKNKKPIITIGSPGGFGIIQYIFQVLTHIIIHNQNIQTAIDLPRFKIGTNFKEIFVENRFNQSLYKSLIKNGFSVKLLPEWTDIVGGVEGIQKNKDENFLCGYDIRRNSSAIALF